MIGENVMVIIEIVNRHFDSETRTTVEEPVACIEVENAKLTVVSGDAGWSYLTETVVDHPETKDILTFEDDPELWAMTLPETLSTGDTVANVRRKERVVAEAEP